MRYLIFLSCIVYFFSFRISLRRGLASSFEGRFVATLIVLISVCTAVVASARLVPVVARVVVRVWVQRLVDSGFLVEIVVIQCLLKQEICGHVLVLLAGEVSLRCLSLSKAETLQTLDRLHFLVSDLEAALGRLLHRRHLAAAHSRHSAVGVVVACVRMVVRPGPLHSVQ
jgi:hypothetical protein